MRLVKSRYVRIIFDDLKRKGFVYHTLFGNPRILNTEGLEFLELFNRPIDDRIITEMCNGSTDQVIKEFLGIHFLVNPDFDERIIIHKRKQEYLQRVNYGETIDRMGLAISDCCNFGCPACLHFRGQRTSCQFYMSFETAKRCVDEYVVLVKKQGRRFCKIHFGNAEPLMNWPVVEKILEYCGKMRDLTFEFAINTNLSLLTKRIAERLKYYKVRIATSLDGVAAANNAVRITKEGKGTFHRIIEKFDLLAEVDYPLDGFSITVTDSNFSLVDTDIIDFAAERGMKSIALDYDLVNLVNIPIEARVVKLMRLKKYANKHGIDFFGTWDSAFRNLTSRSLLLENHAFCAAVEGRSLEFNVDGSIKICNHAATNIGHLNQIDGVFSEKGGLFRIVGDRFPGTDKYCFGCAIEGSCGGQCHLTREVAGKDLFSDLCDFYRSITDALILENLKEVSESEG